ncbi:MAG: hypothetical protein V4618_13560 [Pseudomonadota bacterium]
MFLDAAVFTAKVAGSLAVLILIGVALIVALLIVFHLEQSRKANVPAAARKSPGLIPLSDTLAQNEAAREWYAAQEVKAAKDELALARTPLTEENVAALLTKWRSAASKA